MWKTLNMHERRALFAVIALFALGAVARAALALFCP